MTVTFIADRSVWSDAAAEYVKQSGATVLDVRWAFGEELRPRITQRTDWILSFKSDLILTQSELDLARRSSVNFHPAPPRYRGVGGHFWAISNGDSDFGVTCHHMVRRVDWGPIVSVKTFPISRNWSADQLKLHADLCLTAEFFRIIDLILHDEPLPSTSQSWSPRLYKRTELPSIG